MYQALIPNQSLDATIIGAYVIAGTRRNGKRITTEAAARQLVQAFAEPLHGDRHPATRPVAPTDGTLFFRLHNHPGFHRRRHIKVQRTSCLPESSLRFIATSRNLPVRYAQHDHQAAQQNDLSAPGPIPAQDIGRA